MRLFKQNNQNTGKKAVFTVFVSIVGAAVYIFRAQSLKKLIKGETRELHELQTGQESFNQFVHDSKTLLKDFFIPHKGNNHRPRGLRPKSLATYALLAVGVKVFVTGFLFFTYPTPAQLSAIVSQRIIELHNEARLEAGLEPLVLNASLIDAATRKGLDMLEQQYFAHDTPDGKRPWEWINRSQYDYVYAGENLALDFTSAEVVQSAFMKSPSHRKNILNPKYREIGVAVLQGDFEGRNTILLVNFFGTQRKDLSTLVDARPTPTVAPTQPTQVVAEPAPVIEPVVVPNPTLPTQTSQPAVAGEQIEPVAAQLEPPALETPNTGVIVVAASESVSRPLVDLVIEYSHIFFLGFLIFMIAFLVLNILVKIRVQHSELILQSLVVVVLLAALLLINFHFAEGVTDQIIIL
ncbi:MAG: hypothetical protein A2840_00385 [Candidatus Buchananbacteria bacterium RIFCSPHIGHO2_01_FULL_47_11b]|uniref:SCP domain-containing protein n=1 Tax=Candidatus Buchananbacteria bacterium RIFCSPHIGHO2_01_FULL_47_11b TaxID=1797537 RepID=A0A1G1Y6C2_9BACT|nr:MAG: hypothetical protein A2840_00385 [Candidatus Buchananbacteria bacterium RIFCSPHIGHO2_01_FULL_47_11b]